MLPLRRCHLLPLLLLRLVLLLILLLILLLELLLVLRRLLLLRNLQVRRQALLPRLRLRAVVGHRRRQAADLGGGHVRHARVVPAGLAVVGLRPEALALADGQGEDEDQQDKHEDVVEEGLDDADDDGVDVVLGEIDVDGDCHGCGEPDEVEDGRDEEEPGNL